MAEGIEQTRVALDSLGCKLNQAEIELLASQFAGAGYRVVSATDKADIYILNTCTVTHIADRKSRHLLRLARHRNPDARLVVTGCYAERAPGVLAQIGGVDLVVDNRQKPHLLRLLEESDFLSGQNFPRRDATSGRYDGRRTRALVKVQDGCNYSCAYCIVPLVRGGEKSVPVDQVISGVRRRVDSGGKEVVLTGTEIGAYRCEGMDLKGLLKRILEETIVTRIRLSSLQPGEISPELIGLWHDDRLCPHFHLSLQSGSDAVLNRMKRRYSAADYWRAVSMVRDVLPEAAITTDVIVGFPGETEAEFAESYNFCQQLEFARIHVFPYSPRPGTEAARMSPQVEDKVKKQRSRKMLSLAGASAGNFRQHFLGRPVPVLWEKQSTGVWSGLTGNYIKIYTRSSEDLTNKVVPTGLASLWRDGVWGEL